MSINANNSQLTPNLVGRHCLSPLGAGSHISRMHYFLLHFRRCTHHTAKCSLTTWPVGQLPNNLPSISESGNFVHSKNQNETRNQRRKKKKEKAKLEAYRRCCFGPPLWLARLQMELSFSLALTDFISMMQLSQIVHRFLCCPCHLTLYSSNLLPLTPFIILGLLGLFQKSLCT